jgi:hypothetical protein
MNYLESKHLVKVENMEGKNGNAVPNQFEIQTYEGRIFQSYDSAIVLKTTTGHVILDKKYWNYSRTTSKYRNLFLGETTKETERKIASGEYELADLN